MAAEEEETRRLKNWLQGFMDYTEGLPSSKMFRLWTAIYLVGAALERKVFLKTLKTDRLHANQQIFLVAKPGIGKSVMFNVAEMLYDELPEHKKAASDVSKASFIDQLFDAKRSVGIAEIEPESQFNALALISEELEALFPTYDAGFFGTITKLYDCKPHTEKKRHRGNDDQPDIPRPVINLFFATTPVQLHELLPEGAWQKGFTARTMMIFEPRATPIELFEEVEADASLWKDLVHDYKIIGNLQGQMRVDADAKDLLKEWHRGGGQPRPRHPRLENYLTRRTSQHVIKLSMIASVMESNKLVIKAKHVRLAKAWLLDAEKRMPYIFKAMQSGGDHQILSDVWYQARREFNQSEATESPGITNSRLHTLISERTSEAWKVPHLLTSLLKRGIIKPLPGSPKENPKFSVAKYDGNK